MLRWLAKRCLASMIASLMISPAVAAEESTTFPPKIRFEPHVFEAQDGTRVDAELGTLTVRENRQSDTSRTIDLKFVRFESTAEKPGPPIVYLAGGPGGSGIWAARGTRFPLFMAFREVADVIAFDQRGTGLSGSDDLRCPQRFDLPLEEPSREDVVMTKIRAAAAECARTLRQSGIDLDGYNTVESTDDLDALRQALGAEKITLWGISYGTHLTLATLKRHGEHVDRVIMAGLEGLDQSYKLPSNVEKLVREIGALAQADPKIREVMPDPLAKLEEILARLERQPEIVTVIDPRNGEEVKVGISALDVRKAMSGMLRGPSSFALFVDVIASMERGDFKAIARAAGRSRLGRVGSAMSYATDCASGATAARLRRIEREAKDTLLGDAINLPFPDICEAWDVPDLGDTFRAALRSEIPALFISGTLDGRTPPSNAEEILAGFPRGAHLVIEGAGHSDPLFLSSPAIAETMLAFLRGETVVNRRIALPPVRLVPPRESVDVAPAVLERYVGVYRVDDNATREVVLEGEQLFTRRAGGRKYAIVPSSETEFFYERFDSTVEFVLEEGQVVHMVMFQNGERSLAIKVE